MITVTRSLHAFSKASNCKTYSSPSPYTKKKVKVMSTRLRSPATYVCECVCKMSAGDCATLMVLGCLILDRYLMWRFGQGWKPAKNIVKYQNKYRNSVLYRYQAKLTKKSITKFKPCKYRVGFFHKFSTYISILQFGMKSISISVIICGIQIKGDGTISKCVIYR